MISEATVAAIIAIDISLFAIAYLMNKRDNSEWRRHAQWLEVNRAEASIAKTRALHCADGGLEKALSGVAGHPAAMSKHTRP